MLDSLETPLETPGEWGVGAACCRRRNGLTPWGVQGIIRRRPPSTEPGGFEAGRQAPSDAARAAASPLRSHLGELGREPHAAEDPRGGLRPLPAGGLQAGGERDRAADLRLHRAAALLWRSRLPDRRPRP